MSEPKKIFKSLYFQDEVHNQLMNKFCNQGQECGILKLPTGAGKTFVATKFVIERYLKNGERILWVAQRWTHINHFLKTLSDLKRQDQSIDFDVVLIGDIQNILRDNLNFEIKKYDFFVPSKATVFISSTQSISRSLKVPSKLNLIIFDEDHWGKNGAMREKILRSGGAVATLGLTATPVRSNYSQSPSIIGHEYSYLRLASEGYLARAISTIYNTKKTYIVDKQGLKHHQINRLIRTQSIQDHSRMETVVNFYISNINFFGKTFIFCPSAAYAQRLASLIGEKLLSNGRTIPVDSIVSNRYKPFEYNEVIQKFKEYNGPAILTSFGILSDGVDIPDLKSIFILHKTGSDIKFAQMFGRGTRTDDGKKMTFNVVDFQDNIEDANIAKILSPTHDIYYSEAGFDPDSPIDKYSDSIIMSLESLNYKSEISLWRESFKSIMWDALKKFNVDSNRKIVEVQDQLSTVMATFLIAKLSPTHFANEIQEVFNKRYFEMNWEDFEILATLMIPEKNSTFFIIKAKIKNDTNTSLGNVINRLNLSRLIEVCFADFKLEQYSASIFNYHFKSEPVIGKKDLSDLCDLILRSCISKIHYIKNYKSIRSLVNNLSDPTSFDSRYHIIDIATESITNTFSFLNKDEVKTVVIGHLLTNLKNEWKKLTWIDGSNAAISIKEGFKNNLITALQSESFKEDLNLLVRSSMSKGA